jgi:CRP-like cAMP-binding protein
MKNLLSDVAIFSGLNEKALEAFLGQAKRSAAPAGTIIAREGDTNECMFLIESGKVSIIKNFGSPNPVTLAELGPGQSFGEMCVLETLPRSATAKALVESNILNIPSSAFFKLYRQEPEQYCVILLNIARDLSSRLRQLDEAFATRV